MILSPSVREPDRPGSVVYTQGVFGRLNGLSAVSSGGIQSLLWKRKHLRRAPWSRRRTENHYCGSGAERGRATRSLAPRLGFSGVWEWLTPIFAEHQLSTADREERVSLVGILFRPRVSPSYIRGRHTVRTTCWRAFRSFNAATPRELRVTVDRKLLENNRTLSVTIALSVSRLFLPNTFHFQVWVCYHNTLAIRQLNWLSGGRHSAA